MKQLTEVACALIEHEGRVLAVQRSPGMRQAGLWEFPGGKLESGENAAGCIVREIKEELDMDIRPLKALTPVEHSPIRLIPVICSWTGGKMLLHEHSDARWLKEDDFMHLSWCQADIPVWKEYLQFRQKNKFYE